MADLELITSTVALNINEQSFLIKGKLSISIKQQDPTICCLQKMTFMRRHTEFKSKKDEKLFTMQILFIIKLNGYIWLYNINHKSD